MGELAIRRERIRPAVQRQEAANIPASAGEVRKPGGKTGLSISETLQSLLTGRAEGQLRQSLRTLRAGEAVLDEIQNCLDDLSKLAREAAGDGEPDRTALQGRLEQLRQTIDRMLSSAAADGVPLFPDGDVQGGIVGLLTGDDPYASLPHWLLNGISQDSLTPEQILASLGLDKTASSAELFAAMIGASPENDPIAARLAALYLGAMIAGGGAAPNAAGAAEGLRQLLEKLAQGDSPDQAVSLLTNGAITSLSDFQFQFAEGTLPGLQDFLSDLLLSGGGLPEESLLPLLTGEGGGAGPMADLIADLAADLLAALPSEASAPHPALTPLPERTPPAVLSAQELGGVQVQGRDLSGVSLAADQLVLGGTSELTLDVPEGTPASVLLTGSAAVTLRGSLSALAVEPSVQARVAVPENGGAPGEGAVLEEVYLGRGASLSLEGGPVRIALLRGDRSNALRLAAGAAVAIGNGQGTLSIPAVLSGPASLAARADSVQSASGKALEPFDLVWKTLLPGWSAVTELTVDGRHIRLALHHAARLWLDRGDPSQGSPIHSLIIRGKDGEGHPRTRYAYLHWNQEAMGFEEITLYPNPFTVTGGEEGLDWVYEEETQTLRILSGNVTAVSGGPGTDARQEPFSGRLALADGLGAAALTLDGVTCRVGYGASFRLGRENDVTLILQSGAGNRFESGPGFAGISLGDGTALRVDCSEPLGGERTPPGTLTASGTGGGAGIGRDRGAGPDQTTRIEIRGGVITAFGDGGAGIGGGTRGALGDISVTGGVIEASGAGGGAGIGGAPGGPAGNITLQGGRITALALCHAAAIGAGVRGSCGDISITGTARVLQALGGDPGADIGGCLFGGCGRVTRSGAADIGRAQIWTALSPEDGAAVLPQFRLSSHSMGLDRLSLSTRGSAKAALPVLEADRCLVAGIQQAYDLLYSRLEPGRSRREYGGSMRPAPVRDTAAAGVLLEDIRQSISLPSSHAARAHGKQPPEGPAQLLR